MALQESNLMFVESQFNSYLEAFLFCCINTHDSFHLSCSDDDTNHLRIFGPFLCWGDTRPSIPATLGCHADAVGGQLRAAVMAANAGLAGLNRKHGVKVGAGSVLSMEEVALAVGQKIGHSSIKSTARMNKVYPYTPVHTHIFICTQARSGTHLCVLHFTQDICKMYL